VPLETFRTGSGCSASFPGGRSRLLANTLAGRPGSEGLDEHGRARDASRQGTRPAPAAAGSQIRSFGRIGGPKLEPGKLADFTVLDRNPLSVAPEQITGIQVLATVVDGTPTYQAGTITFAEG
jgi:hypothetical protein